MIKEAPLSADERALGRVHDDEDMHRNLRLRMEDERFEALKMIEWYETKIKSLPADNCPFEYVQSFARWHAHLALILDRMERMGFR
jgi:hypothetical protein